MDEKATGEYTKALEALEKQSKARKLTAGIEAVQWFLAFLFAGFKLVGIIHWDWVWVVSPFWIIYVIQFALQIINWLYDIFNRN